MYVLPGLMLNGKPDIDVEELRPYVIFQVSHDDLYGHQSTLPRMLMMSYEHYLAENQI